MLAANPITTAPNTSAPDSATKPAAQPAASRADPYRAAWTVVLARTGRGDEELRRPILRLSAAQQALLEAVDGRRSLQLLVARQPLLGTSRLARDAARLLAFGLVRQQHGELPRDLVLSAMNVTMQLPAAAFASLSELAKREATVAPAAPPAATAAPIEDDDWSDDRLQDDWLQDSPPEQQVASSRAALMLPSLAIVTTIALLAGWFVSR